MKNNSISKIAITGVSVALILTSCLCLLLYKFDNKYTAPAFQPINGIIFISENELSQHGVRFLIREWEYYPGVLLTPKTAASYTGYRHYVDIGGENQPYQGIGTYRMTLMLPDNERSYTLELPEIFSACQLYINGTSVLKLGDPSPENYTDSITSRIVTFNSSGQTELILAAANFSGVYSGMIYPPAFGFTEDVIQTRELRLLLHSGMILLAALGALLSLTFCIRGSFSSGILNCLLCLCLAGTTGYPLLHSFFTTGFQPWYTIEACCSYGLLLLALILQCFTSGLTRKNIMLLIAPCALGLILVILRFGGAAFLSPSAGTAFSCISLILKYYPALTLIVLSFQALQKKRPRSVLLLYGSVSLAVCLVFDRLLPLYEPIYGGWFVEIGGIILTAAICTSLWLDAAEAYRFRLTYEEGYRRMESQLAIQKEHYHQLSQQVQRARESSHDLRHHMRTMRSMAENQHFDRLIEYLDTYEPHLTDREIQVWSDHPAADAILSHYAAASQKLNAAYDVRLAIPPDLPMPDDELCVILGNLLENAVHAVENQTEGSRRIYLRGQLSQGRLGLIVDNTFNGIVHMKEGKYFSSKHEGMGLGLSSITYIAEKYGGLTDFSAVGTVFHASIMIPLKSM